MVEGEEALEDLLAGSGADGVADTVVFGKGLDFLEVVTEDEVLPAVGVADGGVESNMQAAEFENAAVTAFGFVSGLLADLDDQGGREVACMEEVVDVGEAEPKRKHEGLAVLMVAFAEGG